jgi:hypothetical protein
MFLKAAGYILVGKLRITRQRTGHWELLSTVNGNYLYSIHNCLLIELLSSAELSKESETTTSTSLILTTDFSLATPDRPTVGTSVLKYRMSSMLTLKSQVQL